MGMKSLEISAEWCMAVVGHADGPASGSPSPLLPRLLPTGSTNATDVLDFCEEGGYIHVAVQPTYADFIGDLQYVSVPDGADLAYYRFGNSTAGLPPLVLIAGFGDTMALWTVPFLEHLARDQEVIMFDNRGMGFSKVRRRGMWGMGRRRRS